jgi:hypothetical protein
MFVALAEASTLGWTTVVTSIFAEVRNIGFVCFAGGLVVAGIELIFHRHLDRLGSVMASIGVGGGLIGAGSAAAVGILGGAQGAQLVAQAVHVVGLSEAIGDIAGVLLYHGLLLGTLAGLWWTGKQHGHD